MLKLKSVIIKDLLVGKNTVLNLRQCYGEAQEVGKYPSVSSA